MITQKLKRVTLRVMLLLAAILAVTQAASAAVFEPGTKLYFQPNSNWTVSGASFKANFYNSDNGGDSNRNQLVVMTVLSDGVWECVVPAKQANRDWQFVEIERYNSSGNAYWGGKLQLIYASEGNNLITLKDGVGVSENPAGDNITFSKYSQTSGPGLEVDFPQFGIDYNDNGGNPTTGGKIACELMNDQFPYEYTVTIPDFKSGQWISIHGREGEVAGKRFGPNATTTYTYGQLVGKKMSEALHVYNVTTGGQTGALTLTFTYSDNGQIEFTRSSFKSDPNHDFEVKINGLDGEWGTLRSATATADGKYVYEYTCAKTDIVSGGAVGVTRFRLNIDGKEYTTIDGKNNRIALGNLRPYANQSEEGSWWFYSVEGGVYTFTIDPLNQTVQVVMNECNYENPEANVITITGLAGSFSLNDYRRAEYDGDGKFVYTHEAIKTDITFRIRINGIEHTPGEGVVTPVNFDEDITIDDNFGISGYWRFDSQIGRQYKFIIDPKAHTVRIEPGEQLIREYAIPVVPIRVKDRTRKSEWDKVSEAEPAVYLLSMVLNGERPSPEWEMEKEADGCYWLRDFVMRDTKMKTWKDGSHDQELKASVRIYTSVNDNNENKVAETEWDVRYNNGWDYCTEQLPGQMYNAKYDPSTGKLTFIKNNAKYEKTLDGHTYTVPPYIALIGYHFKQYGHNYETPRGKHTDEGWQESRIQYDENGQVLTDTKNKVMYTTKYPPKYPTYFYVELNGEVRELRTRNLRMNVQTDADGTLEIKKGYEWKAELEAKDADAYANLFNSSFNGGQNGPQRLDDNTLYAHYTVENVWILGATKFWTGWTGTTTDNGLDNANWSNHINWGWRDKEDSYDPIYANKLLTDTPYQMRSQAANFMYDKPTFLKTVEIFYALDPNADADAGMERTIFYSTQGFGRPSIDAKTDKEHTFATYQMNIAELPEGAEVTGFEVHRYNSITDQPCDKNGNTVTNRDDARLHLGTEVYNNQAEVNSKFNEVYKFNVKDLTEDLGLASGKYYYMLTVHFQIGDKKRTEQVTSSPVTIVNATVRTTPRAYQLVNNYDTTIVDEKGDMYEYVTYSERYANDPTASVFGVHFKPKADGSKEGVLQYEPIAKLDPSYYLDGSKSQWTDNVLIFCECPKELLEGGSLASQTEIVNYVLSTDNAEVILEHKLRGPDVAKYAPNSYAAIVNFRQDDYSFQTYRVGLVYNIRIPNENGTVDRVTRTSEMDKVNFSYTFPVPYPGEAEYEVVLGGKQTGMAVDVPQHGGVKTVNDDNEHEFRVSVPMGRMNIDESIRSKVYSLLDTEVQAIVNGVTNQFDLKVGESTWDNAENPEENYIVFDMQDPNDWFETSEQGVITPRKNSLSVHPVYRNGIKGFPVNGQWKTVYLESNSEIAAPELSKPAVYRGVVPVPGETNLYCQQLVLVNMPVDIDNRDQAMHGVGLTMDKDMHVMVKKDGEYMSVADADEDSMHRLSHLTSKEHVCVIEESEDKFPWYAEMDDAKLVGNEPVNLEMAYAWFFKGNKEVRGTGAMQLTAAAVKAAAAAEGTSTSHYMFLSPYGNTQVAVNDIMTSVDEVEADANSVVRSGKGWIEVMTDEAKVYNAEGMLVGGAGRTELVPGVYVVRAAGKVSKVVVR